jgi:hypothetical protein
MVLTRQERERLVLDLYHNQGKNTRQIAEEARMSFSAIGAILKKAEQENETSKEQTEKISQAAQAYKLFSEGKSPVDVAITLNLRQAEVTEFYREYWKLKQLYNLNQVYDEIKDDIYPFVKLYMLSKVARMDTQHVIRLLTLANDDLPAVEYRYERLKREEGSLQARNHNSAITFQELSDLVSTTRGTLEQYESDCEEKRLEITKLQIQRIGAETLVKDFQNNNETYLQIKQTVKREVESILTARRQLLKFAVLCIFESLRKDPRKFYALYNNMSSSSAKSPSSSSSPKTTGYGSIQQQYDYVPFMNEQNSPIIDYSNEEICEKILLDESEELYDKMVKDLTNKTVTDVASYDSESSSLLPMLPQSNEEQQANRSHH